MKICNMSMQDKELVALFKEGSQKAFEELYIRYEKRLIRFCNRWLKDECRAEDIPVCTSPKK